MRRGPALIAVGGAVLFVLAAFASAPAEVGARSRAMCAVTLLGTIVYVLANLVAAARVAPPGFEPSELQVGALRSRPAPRVWEPLRPAAVTSVLLVGGRRVLTVTAGGTGALL